ncbi:alpha-1,3-arabinosyltransferase XAT2 [Tanacetum coccineum]
MEGITNFTIKSIQEAAQDMPKCTKTHNVTAIVFSVGGYAGNNFHAFTDVIIPLYETSRVFNREVKFLVANKRSRWTSKFQEVLDKLSRYKIIDIDQEKEVHCFPSMIVGLRKEEKKELHMETIKDFTDFLRSTYSLKRLTATNLTNSTTKKPRLLIVSRQKTRTFTNEKDVVRTAQGLGFEVIVTEMNANLTQVSRLVNSCDVMMGVHGAGLTNMVFLPENGVLIQVVPWGKMDWLANTYFREPSKAIGLKYLEYKINVEESSLIKQYPLNHQVFLDPFSVQKKGWDAYKSIYLDNQNINVNVTRLKKTLSRALELLKFQNYSAQLHYFEQIENLKLNGSTSSQPTHHVNLNDDDGDDDDMMMILKGGRKAQKVKRSLNQAKRKIYIEREKNIGVPSLMKTIFTTRTGSFSNQPFSDNNKRN